MAEELRAWLTAQKLAKYVQQFADAGVESLDDLRILETEAEMLELAGPQGVNMGVVFRKKFVRSVRQLKDTPAPAKPAARKPSPPSQEDTPPGRHSRHTSTASTGSTGSTGSAASRGLKASAVEDRALARLVKTIRSHTKHLKVARESRKQLRVAAEEYRATMTQLFDLALGTMVSRRKQLETLVQKAEKETTERLEAQVKTLQAAAMQLLQRKKEMQQRMRTEAPGPAREQGVMGVVEEALSEVPECETMHIICDVTADDTKLADFVQGFGTISVQTRKGGLAPADK